MKKRLFLAFIIIMATVSCTIPFTHGQGNTDIKSVIVTPSSGERDFSLEVGYDFKWDRE